MLSRFTKYGFCVLIPIALVAAAECAAGLYLRHSDTASSVVDIQSPASLFAKLDQLKRFQGRKIVLVGDSLIYGGILEDFGDQDWRQHQLSALLEERFAAEQPDQPTLVMNLGINGALPSDVEVLVNLIVACQVDLIIVDTHLRPFSRDFAEPDMQFVRPWLKNIDKGELSASIVLGQFSNICQLREFTQQGISSSSLARQTRDARRRMNGQPQSETKTQDPDLVLLQLHNRLSTVDFGADNPQRQAFERTLTALDSNNTKAIFFYAKENPDQVHSVLSPQRHRNLYGSLIETMRPHLNSDIVYVPPCPTLYPRHYHDYSHLNHEGYQVLVDHLWPAIIANLP